MEAEEGSGDLTVEGDVIADQEFVDADTFGGAVQSQKGTKRGGIGGGGRGNVVVEGDFLHSPDPVLAPAGGGQDVHHHDFGGRLGLVFFEEVFDQFDKTICPFDFQNDGLREDTMTGTVARGVEFALRSDGPLDLAPLAREACNCLGVFIRPEYALRDQGIGALFWGCD